MTLKTDDITRGGQLALLRFRMFMQVNNAMFYYLVILWLVVSVAVIYFRMNTEIFHNGVQYWWARSLVSFTQIMRSPPVFELWYQGHAYVSCGNTSVSMKVNEKADIIWQILQSDVLFKKQTRMWWRAVGFMLRKAFLRAPAVLLPAVCLVLWFLPGKVVALAADIQTGAAMCLVYAAGNILFIVYIVTGGVFGICEMLRRQDGDVFCFAPEYQAQVREFARAQQKAGVAVHASSVSRQEADE
ncbi:TraD N-terminal domain-containing protein [Klebsiella sp. PL-2018]|uniref:TraD N-terminal domain-containing protein n=1 Tax=Klebsiella sp. PL-2018 TaxID=2851540 RepID=UPI001C23FECC|nr:TraD N-terminal domain-containing protein [Klebsiella sp. PL-2018]QXD01168.1 IncF plasmid conjugative transfer protein TraD [Klebsiella sp. PL-2018]